LADEKGSREGAFFLVLRGIPGTLDAAPATSSRHGGPRGHGPEPSVPGWHGAEPSVPGWQGAEPSVPTLAAQTPLRVRKGRPLRGSCIYWPTAAPLVGNSPRGWAPKTLLNPEVRGGRADEATPLRLPDHRHRHAVNQPASRDRPRGSAQRRRKHSPSWNACTSTMAMTVRFDGHTHANGSPSS
jgi:hypothetical protein